jgi:hypothetical protein
MAEDGQIDAGTWLLVLVSLLLAVMRSLLARPAAPFLCLSLCVHLLKMPARGRAYIIPLG